MKKTLRSVLAAVVATQLLFSCSPARYYEFAAKSSGYHNSKAKPAAANNETETEQAPAIASATSDEIMSLPPAPAQQAARAIATVHKVAAAPVAQPALLAEQQAEPLKLTKEQKREVRKELRKHRKPFRVFDAELLLKIILAIFIPPLAIYIHEGVTTYFWISLILLLLVWFGALWWLPGVVFALLVVTDVI